MNILIGFLFLSCVIPLDLLIALCLCNFKEYTKIAKILYSIIIFLLVCFVTICIACAMLSFSGKI